MSEKSEIIRYIKQNPLEPGHFIFTNDPLALYILANIKCEKKIVSILPSSGGNGGKTEKSTSFAVNVEYDYFIWFNNVNKQDYPYSRDDLENSANVKNIIHLKDGSVFRVQRTQ